MLWIDASGFERRPLVFVEDHLYHTAELAAALHAVRPDLLAQTTLVVIDRAGPDTNAAVDEWLARWPALQVAAAAPPHARLRAITPDDTRDAASFARFVAARLRPGGLLVQDVQLSTLAFVPADRWWESIYIAATTRGLFADRAPSIRFLSNKRGYSATFGRDLLDAGFDPRDVMDKAALADVVVPTIAAWFDRAFPLQLATAGPRGPARVWRVADAEAERREIEAAFDLVLWPSAQGTELGGRGIGLAGRVTLKTGSTETETWRRLIGAHAAGQGLPVVDVGARLAPAAAERAEITNVAARHIHTLRQRLREPSAIVTADHAYRLGDDLTTAEAARVR